MCRKTVSVTYKNIYVRFILNVASYLNTTFRQFSFKITTICKKKLPFLSALTEQRRPNSNHDAKTGGAAPDGGVNDAARKEPMKAAFPSDRHSASIRSLLLRYLRRPVALTSSAAAGSSETRNTCFHGGLPPPPPNATDQVELMRRRRERGSGAEDVGST